MSDYAPLMALTSTPQPTPEPKLVGEITDFLLDEYHSGPAQMDKLDSAMLDVLTASNMTPERAVAALLHAAKVLFPRLRSDDNKYRGLPALLRWKEIDIEIKRHRLADGGALDSTEIRLRYMRRAAQLVREGQTNGLVNSGVQGTGIATEKYSSLDFFANHNTRTEAYLLGALDEETFEALIAEQRANGHMSQRQIAQILRSSGVEPMAEPGRGRLTSAQREEMITTSAAAGMTASQIAQQMGVSAHYVRSEAKRLGIDLHADKVVGRGSSSIDPVRIITETVHGLEGMAYSLRLLGEEPLEDVLTQDEMNDYADSLNRSIRDVTKLARTLKKQALLTRLSKGSTDTE